MGQEPGGVLSFFHSYVMHYLDEKHARYNVAIPISQAMLYIA